MGGTWTSEMEGAICKVWDRYEQYLTGRTRNGKGRTRYWTGMSRYDQVWGRYDHCMLIPVPYLFIPILYLVIPVQYCSYLSRGIRLNIIIPLLIGTILDSTIAIYSILRGQCLLCCTLHKYWWFGRNWVPTNSGTQHI